LRYSGVKPTQVLFAGTATRGDIFVVTSSVIKLCMIVKTLTAVSGRRIAVQSIYIGLDVDLLLLFYLSIERDAILTCAQKLKEVSLIYRTEPKSGKKKK